MSLLPTHIDLSYHGSVISVVLQMYVVVIWQAHELTHSFNI